MAFTAMRFYQFRNLQSAEIPVHSEQVFFVGENGQGKTNFLEAVYLLCYGSSFRTRKDDSLIRSGADSMAVHGVFTHQGIERVIQVRIVGGKKEVRVDDQVIKDRRELVEQIPCIVFSHEDIDFVKGPPEMQRYFFNQTGTMLGIQFLDDLRRYTRVLKTRNQVLKDGRYDLLDLYDSQLCEYGEVIQERRRELTEQFNAVFLDVFSRVSGLKPSVEIQYQPSWSSTLSSDQLREHVYLRREADISQRTTTSGPHRDRFVFSLMGEDFLPQASTGQLRLISLILRVAQARLLADMRDSKPILLIDDVLLELDPERRRRFIEVLPEFEQAFYTFLPDEHIIRRIEGDSTVGFRVENGSFQRITS
ncbi:DNA replication/repair protein RecF [Spirochaeta lutea]|uniref:DNA replication and repair protein RecF n=1 Tax=Spirochaeta lutea TaxID=1480694 RepID=A0A098QWZ7_9SPIO|nr:DNA replication and repair protein RecF [Spirochaeta lutea]KGE71923.1 DNA recombination protein RecF [Spirochaeta lutea]